MIETILFQYLLGNPLAGVAPKPFREPPGINLTLVSQPGQKNPPVRKKFFVAPELSAESVLALDIDSQTILFQKRGNEKRQIASISKLMTAIVILDGNLPLGDKVTVSKNASLTEGRNVGLKAGETITMENLLFGMLIHSGNDAAVALAEYDTGSTVAFVKKMNDHARVLGLTHTHFENPAGLDSAENYSTARDIAVFAQDALAHPFIRDTARITEKEIRSVDGTQKHMLETTNDLLKQNLFHVTGLKTGNTLGAGPSLVALSEQDGHHILTVILGSEDRFKETKILLDWIFRAYGW